MSDLIIPPREKDLGDLTVRRVLPYAHRRMVGPFIFFDHMGPAEFDTGHAMDVRPHPHINLATVTYLFKGRIRHRDSLGSDQVIEPGAINWMTAGRGIVHSERTPQEEREHTNTLHGIQLWVGLPQEMEECDPSFTHHPASRLPEFEVDGVPVKLLLGSAYGHTSPVDVFSKMFYLDARMKKGQKLVFPANGQEFAAYAVSGHFKSGELEVPYYSMLVSTDGGDVEIEALEDCRILFLGGEPIGPRFIEWNFVSSSKERIEEAKTAWRQGPSPQNPRFQTIPEDDKEFIPLP